MSMSNSHMCWANVVELSADQHNLQVMFFVAANMTNYEPLQVQY